MPTATTEHTRIRGEVERVFFSSANFSAGRFITERGDRIQFAGNVVVQENQPLVLHGKFVRHPKYGFQFEVTSMEFDRQMDARGLANYLANNPDIKGIGPAKARIIAERFGSEFEQHLIDEPEKIADAAKVPISLIESLRDHWLETSSVNQAMTALAAYGLTHHQVTRLVKKLGNNAVGIIERDPYVIVGEIDGFGFKRIDKIARQVGIAKDEPSRVRAGIVFCVDDALDQGDCWVEYEDLLDRANELLVMDCLDSREQIEKHLDNLIDEKSLTCYPADCRFLVAKPFIRSTEEDLARVFAGGVKPSPCLGDKSDLQTEVKRVAPRLNPKQLDAAVSAAAHSISLISGGAGSGKTFTVAAMTRLCDEHDLRVVLCAPTGKAAKRMEEATGREASTIHRLLGFNGKTYARDSENPISADMLIVDEVSMVDVVLAWHLFQAIDLDRTAVVLVGDHNQLPPVGPGNILRDLIESRVLPTTVLDDIVRQAGILKENSIAILKGEVPKTPQRDTSARGAWYVADQHTDAERVQRFVLDLFEHTLNEKLGFDILRDVQLLTPTHKGPLGTVELNTKLQRLIQRKLWNYDAPPVQTGRRPKLLVNDKVIQTRNNYDLGVMNGAMGIVRSVGLDGSLTIEFEDKTVHIEAGVPQRSDIQLAYALTIHKSQGSEFPCSVVIAHKSHSFMHHRNLLYTGVTRASQTAIIVGDHWGIANCAKRVQVDARKTFLSLLLNRGAQ
ncbi:MAG: AAA family ATPase [Armatimonadetes bacterium]|nr:AAA family ATPase [Armatimonadota bacterium]